MTEILLEEAVKELLNTKEKFCKIGVVGAGTMGSGIAQVLAVSGYFVFLVDLKPELLNSAYDRIKQGIDKLKDRGKISSELAIESVNRVSLTPELNKLKDCQFIIEAISEDKEVKLNFFTVLNQIVSDRTIISSNTSTISITELGSKVANPNRFIGMHFMNPVPLMPLVEIIRGLQTDDETYLITAELARSLGKVSALVNDSPGFVANRIIFPMLNEAFLTLQEGVASRENIDLVLKSGFNHPLGPLALADLIGLDVCLAILDVLYDEFGTSKFKAAPILKRMVAAGFLGRKAGRGFYEYSQ
jgi:3-hydroxybutyryl-CoA dehydrogenase